MKIYIAAPYSDRFKYRPVANTLTQNGHSITSRWIWYEIEDGSSTQLNDHHARLDLSDVRISDVIINFPGSTKSRGGKHIEFGYALALGKKLVVVGGPENIFHYLKEVEHFKSVEDLLNVATTEWPI